MTEKYNVYLVSDSTGETLDRIFLSLKSQFSNFDYNKKEFVFEIKQAMRYGDLAKIQKLEGIIAVGLSIRKEDE